MTNIIEALKETNKWWKGYFEVDYQERIIYKKLKKYLKTRQILALTGLRRVGKTTLMLKLVKDLIKEGHDKQNIAYLSFDNFRDIEVKEVIKNYLELMHKKIEEENYVFLFDEIQKVDSWEEQIKRVYDNYKNIKIILSGSESLFIRKRSKESLAGRFFEFKINQLSFKEFLIFKDFKLDNIQLQSEEISFLFDEFVFTNGFPEIIGADKEIIEKYIQEGILEKVIYRDIPQIFPIENPEVLESIFRVISDSPGEIINIEELADEQNISRQTASLYLDYLEKSFLIKKIYNFSKNARKTERKLKKYYPTVISPKVIGRCDEGKVFETVAVLNLGADFFWRDVYKKEVDIILNDEKIVPIEIKLNKVKSPGLFSFMKKFKLSHGYILTKEKEQHINKDHFHITVMPLWKWLLENS